MMTTTYETSSTSVGGDTPALDFSDTKRYEVNASVTEIARLAVLHGGLVASAFLVIKL